MRAEFAPHLIDCLNFSLKDFKARAEIIGKALSKNKPRTPDSQSKPSTPFKSNKIDVAALSSFDKQEIAKIITETITKLGLLGKPGNNNRESPNQSGQQNHSTGN